MLALRDVADDPEWRCAEQSVRLIAERGFARGRDLGGALTTLRAG